ncbi:MAG: enolase C-terminal domain-like protein [Anaerolineales bacterium]|nr:enolase C-terminal domain-like protein [Anaerolineales bacterium]
MQITKAEVTPVELKLKQAVQMANIPLIQAVTAVFVRLETRQGQSAWGCTIAHPQLNDSSPEDVVRACRECAAKAVDLHPLNVEYSLAELAPLCEKAPSALCAFDLAFHDLLGLAADMPLYRLLGGYRNRIQTSITLPIASESECVEMALMFARQGFRILKIKGGLDAEQDVRRVQAIRRALPNALLRLDADGAYSVQQALDVAHALQGELEFLEQPTPPGDLEALHQITRLSPIPVLADQSACGPDTALKIAAQRAANGLCVKLAACGGLRAAQQIDAIARAARMAVMVSCLVEPALLIAAGLSLALSSPNVQYGDLDGFLYLLNDPSQPGFFLQDGWLIASDVPGLGYSVNLG